MEEKERKTCMEKLNCVYLIFTKNEKFKGRTYIGFTVDPERRLKQHNAGIAQGGASKTNNKGPWEMLLFVHGFPNKILSLKFEWAWQNPHLSRRLKDVKKKSSKETNINFCVRVLYEMLKIKPWKRFPLEIQWLNKTTMEEAVRFSYLHYVSFAVESLDMSPLKTFSFMQQRSLLFIGACFSCQKEIIGRNYLLCINPSCKEGFHIVCLAFHFLQGEEEIIPFRGKCPSCYFATFWVHILLFNRHISYD